MRFLIVLICLILTSCSSYKFKSKPEKYFEVIAYDLNAEHYKDKVYFYTTKDSHFNCFEENSKNKEVITVRHNHLAYAIDHFYKRKAGVSIKLKQYPTGYKLDVGALRIDTEIPLEVASCLKLVKVGLFNVIETRLVSFREAD